MWGRQGGRETEGTELGPWQDGTENWIESSAKVFPVTPSRCPWPVGVTWASEQVLEGTGPQAEAVREAVTPHHGLPVLPVFLPELESVTTFHTFNKHL